MAPGHFFLHRRLRPISSKARQRQNQILHIHLFLKWAKQADFYSLLEPAYFAFSCKIPPHVS